MVRLPSHRVMLKAFAEKDAAFDGTFFVAVKTTGVFCRPVCRAKPARPENVEFFATAQRAIKDGYRPCKLCKPLEPGASPPLVRKLIDLAERSSEPITEYDLREMGIEPTTARRKFQSAMKTTFSAWQRSRRLGRAAKELHNGANMTAAQLTAGFESPSGFRDALTRLFPATDPRDDAAQLLTADWLETPLGPMLAMASDDGIVMLDFIDKSGFDPCVERFKRRQDDCVVTPGEHPYLKKLKSQLTEYFAARKEFSVPLDPHGTAFELLAWEFLRTIPFAETRSYAQQARAIRKPSAMRAVGAANGRNDISILIPCHRVIGANGSLVGYGGGLERKKWLLEHERKTVGAVKSDLFRG